MKVILTKLCRKIIFLVTVIMIFISCEEIVLEKDISEKTIELIAPVNNAQFLSTGISFTWNNVTDATHYQLQIARPNFDNPLQIVLDTTIVNTSFTQQLPLGQYEWRVRAINSGYNTTYSKRLFTILSNDEFENNLVQLISPSANLITNNTSQNLNWQEIIGATNYEIQIIDSNNSVILNQNIVNPSYLFTFPEGSFQWKVRASNGSNFTLFSMRNLLVDSTPPNTPLLTTPSNNSIASAGSISFHWNRTPILGSPEKDSIYIYTNANLTTLLQKNESPSPYNTNLTSGTYYWRVKSFDSAGNNSNISTTYSIIVN